jgi:hypothetical protein
MTVNIPPSQQEEDGEPPQQASVALKFIIVGSGVGGLVAAIALRDAGHTVLILDSRSKSDVLSETNGESFYIGPNTHRVLTRCGVILPKEETWQAGLTSLRRCQYTIPCWRNMLAERVLCRCGRRSPHTSTYGNRVA